jgi:hypothetical protein
MTPMQHRSPGAPIVIVDGVVALAVCICWCLPVGAQEAQGQGAVPFEGVIVYDTEVESVPGGQSAEELKAYFGDTMEYYFKDGNYRMVFRGGSLREVLYRADKNRQYTMLEGASTVYWVSMSEAEDPMLGASMVQGAGEVAGRPCDLITMSTLKGAVIRYHFDPSLAIDPEPLQEHHYGHVAELLRLARAPYLLYEYEGTDYRLSHRARSVERRELDDELFAKPKGRVKKGP